MVFKFVPASNSLLTIWMIIKYNKIFVDKYAIGIEEARLLSEQEKSVRVQTSKRFLERYAREGERFLQSSITCDKSWLHFYDPETKVESMVWKHTSSPPPRSSSLLTKWCSCFLQTTVGSLCRMPSQKFRRSTQHVTRRYPINGLFVFPFLFRI